MFGGIQNRISKHFILYAFIGVSGVLLDLLGLYILEGYFGVNYQLANLLSMSLGITNNFFLNTFLNFQKRDGLLSRYFKFYVIAFVGLGITAFALWGFVGQLGWDLLYTKALAVIAIFPLQYLLNKRFSFGE